MASTPPSALQGPDPGETAPAGARPRRMGKRSQLILVESTSILSRVLFPQPNNASPMCLIMIMFFKHMVGID